MNLSFKIYGVDQPQGSTRAFVPKGGKRPIITSDNPKQVAACTAANSRQGPR